MATIWSSNYKNRGIGFYLEESMGNSIKIGSHCPYQMQYDHNNGVLLHQGSKGIWGSHHQQSPTQKQTSPLSLWYFDHDIPHTPLNETLLIKNHQAHTKTLIYLWMVKYFEINVSLLSMINPSNILQICCLFFLMLYTFYCDLCTCVIYLTSLFW